jgi:hypothetical protein
MNDSLWTPVSSPELLASTSRELASFAPALADAIRLAEHEFGSEEVRRRAVRQYRDTLARAREDSHATYDLIAKANRCDCARLRREARDPWTRFLTTCRRGLDWLDMLGPTMDRAQAGAVLMLAVAIYDDEPAPHPALPPFLQRPGKLDSMSDFGTWMIAGHFRQRLATPECVDRILWARSRLQAARPLSGEACTAPAVRSATTPLAPALTDIQRWILDMLRALAPGQGCTAKQLAQAMKRGHNEIVSDDAIGRAIKRLNRHGYRILNHGNRAGYYLSP